MGEPEYPDGDERQLTQGRWLDLCSPDQQPVPPHVRCQPSYGLQSPNLCTEWTPLYSLPSFSRAATWAQSHPPTTTTMGVLQDETFSDTLKLAFTAGMLSHTHTIPCTFSGQTPNITFSPPHFMNPTTTEPLTTTNPHPPTKTLRPSHTAIPLCTIIPLVVPTPQAQAPPPQSPPPPHPLNSAFWNAVDCSVRGAAALAQLLSVFGEAISQKVRSRGRNLVRSKASS